MGPTVILDKSALQSLSKDESFFLHRYFIVNVPPVLVMEILADLKKKDDRGNPSRRVSEYAGKLLFSGGCVNGHFQELIRQSLSGNEPAMDGRPNLRGSTVRTIDGDQVAVIEQDPEELAIQRWKDGNFEDSEELLAERWRTTTKSIDIEGIQKALRKDFRDIQRIDTASDLLSVVDDLLGNSASQVAVLTWMLTEYKIETKIANKVVQRFQFCGYESLSELAPYAYYCMRVSVFYYLGLFHKCTFVGTRRTNCVDLEYLFYLPFCHAFVSNDAFHKNIVGPFLRTDQVFIQGIDLKADLAAIVDLWPSLNKVQRNDSWPPDGSGDVVMGLWNKFCTRRPDAGNRIPFMTDSQKEALYDRLKPLIDKTLAGSEQVVNSQDGRFMIRKTSYRLADPCICGSGIPAGECCLKNVERHT